MPVTVSVLLGVLGVILIVVAIVYFAEPAGKLPSFFPGHAAGSTHHHSTHGLASLIVGLVALAAAWMGAGAKKKTA